VVAEFAVGVGAGLVPHKADRRPWAAGGLPRGSRVKPGAPCRRSVSAGAAGPPGGVGLGRGRSRPKNPVRRRPGYGLPPRVKPG
jgi:hypothetical protein